MCLFDAIIALSDREIGAFHVYSGLNGVKLDQKRVANGYFATYVSTSWRKSVATDFMGDGNGMIIKFDKGYKSDNYVYCCDVSWISKFDYECEVLFARSRYWGCLNQFSCKVIDESKNIQTVLLGLAFRNQEQQRRVERLEQIRRRQ